MRAFERPVEPVLPMSEIQGIVVPGFLKPHHTLLGIIASDEQEAAFKNLVRDLADEISTAAETLADRRKNRVVAAIARSKFEKAFARSQADTGQALVAIGFSFQGLRKLTPGAEALPSDAFRQGLAARSAFLGDPIDPEDEGHPQNWKVGATDAELDALIVIAGNTRASVDRRAGELEKRIEKAGLQVSYKEEGDVRADLPGHEHFGFDDGISQPGIRGRASDAPDDFLTTRHLADSAQPAQSLFGRPGQDLVWPGVFVLGQPATSPDPLIAGVPSESLPEWSRNGSYLVFRRLRQDVGLFWRTMRDEAARLATLPGFAGLTDVDLAARLVGRWPSGAPVNRSPLADNPALGDESLANNHFRFDSDATPLPLASGYQDPFPQSKADPAGITCPWAAHVRKVNTRDSGSDTGGRDATYSRRLLRVGVPFGKPLEDRFSDPSTDPEKGERGLLFLSIQASIEEQFEFLTVRWMGDPSRPKMPGGHDLIVGQNNAPGEARERRCVLFGANAQPATVSTAAQWIVPTGGGYFFVPSIVALRDVLGA